MATTQTKNLNDYKIDSFVYPEDLSSNLSYSENKVLFFINVAAGSKLVQQGVADKKYELWDVPDSDLVKVTGGDSAAALRAGYEGTRKLVGADENFSTSAVSSKMQRLSVAIALYVPNSIIQGTTVGWDEEDLTSVIGDAMDAAAKGVGEAFNVAKAQTGAVDTTGAAVSGGVVAGIDSVSAAGTGGFAAILKQAPRAQRLIRQTPGNSKKELLFSAVNFRTFDFNYQFAPKSEKEAENVMNIIRMFKHHMLPEFTSESKAIYIYPSEFNVKYYKGSKENPYIEKQMTAILEGVNVDYTPNGQFNTFANGMPQQINLSLRFKELSTPSKETSPYDSHGV
jgi:hypothetical protein